MSFTLGNLTAIFLMVGGIFGVVGYTQIGWAFVIAAGAVLLSGVH